MTGGCEKAGLAVVGFFGGQPGLFQFGVGFTELDSALLDTLFQCFVDQL